MTATNNIETHYQRSLPAVRVDSFLGINEDQFGSYINNLRGEVSSGAVRPYVVFDREGVMVIGVEDVENGEKTTILTAKVIRITDLPYVKTQLERLFPEEGENRDFIQPAIESLENAYTRKEKPVFFLEQESVTEGESEDGIGSAAEIEGEKKGSSAGIAVRNNVGSNLSVPTVRIPGLSNPGLEIDKDPTERVVRAIASGLLVIRSLMLKETRVMVDEAIGEYLQKLLAGIRARGDRAKLDHYAVLLDGLESALPRLGSNMSLDEFLLQGFLELQRKGEIGQNINFRSPEGFLLALEKVAGPAILQLTVAAENLSERADAEAEVGKMIALADLAKRKADAQRTLADEEVNAETAKIRAKKDIEIERGKARAELIARIGDNAGDIKKGVRASSDIWRAKFEGLANASGGLLRGVFKMPAEVFGGVFDGLKEFAQKEPLIATGVAAATALWVEAAIAGTAIPAGWIIACIGGGVGLEVLWDRIIAPAIEPWLETRGINIHHEDDNDESV